MEENIKKKKVLILYNKLFHYRVPIFNLLAEKFDLTVVFSIGTYAKEDVSFNVKKIPVIKFNKFTIHKNNIHKFCQSFDVVIAYGDIAWLSYSSLGFIKRNLYKLIYWSPGVSASYNKKFDSVTKWDSIRDFFYKRADALVFYTSYPIDKYFKRGFEKEKLFVAPNTVEVFKLEKNNRDSLLFIGTLYMQKGILNLLENYKLAYDIDENILPLNIIGGGEELDKVRTWIQYNELTGKIFLRGSIFDTFEKSKYFSTAIACISPVQAGLSVLESMGYGVPFVTMNDSITGGERLNIKNGVNGILLKEISELKDIILDLSHNKEKYLKMGENAYKYYIDSHKPLDMANGLINAIEFVSR